MIEPAVPRSQPGPWRVLGVPCLLAATVVGIMVYAQGGSLGWSAFLPFVVLAATYTRHAFFVYAVPSLLFVQLADGIFHALDDATFATIGCCSMVICVLVFRVMTASPHAIPKQNLRRQLTFARERAPLPREARDVRWVELGSLMLIPGAWFLGGQLMESLSVDGREARASYGVLPATLLVVRLLGPVAMIWIVLNAILEYFRLRQSDPVVSGAQLLRESWAWNGREQKLVARQFERAASWHRGESETGRSQ